MKIKTNFCRVLFCFIFTIANHYSCAAEQKFTITKGGDVQMCKEILNILDSTENEHLLKKRDKKQNISLKYDLVSRVASKLIIPPKYTNFSLVKWKDIKLSDIGEYIDKESNSYKIDFLNKHKKSIKMQGATIDFDEDNKDVKVLKIEEGSKIICDINSNYELDDYLKSYGGGCAFLYYNGVAYRIDSSAYIKLYKLKEPKKHPFNQQTVCMFNPK